jgi:hypothetical protein
MKSDRSSMAGDSASGSLSEEVSSHLLHQADQAPAAFIASGRKTEKIVR